MSSKKGDKVMSTRTRIKAIQLSRKLDKDPAYARRIGVSVVLRNPKSTGIEVKKNEFLFTENTERGKHESSK
jgi:hypothetical protein